MSYKTSETQTSHIEIDDGDIGVIEINGSRIAIDANIAKFILELIDEIESLKEQLSYFNSGNA